MIAMFVGDYVCSHTRLAHHVDLIITCSTRLPTTRHTQVAQGRMYTSLATGRIQELAAEIEPLRESRAAAQTEIARLEALQVGMV
jgi:hypothetical protein